MNIAEIESELSSLTQERFDPSEFVFRLIEIYHAPKATITKLRQGTQNKADFAGDLLWRTKLYYRTAEKGATAITVQKLAERKLAETNKARIILATDGEEVSALDTQSGVTLHCAFTELNDHFTFFLPLANVETYQAIEENKADIKAANRLSKFHDEIIRQNPDWATEERRHELNLFMTRLLFCMFAEDTGIFGADTFTKIISDFGGDSGGQLQFALKPIFDIMNVKPEDRGEKPAHVLAFPYVNGGLFAHQTEVPKFNKRAKNYLLDAAQLDWADINPDIFGSMIQAVVDTEMRGDLGMHYTSVPNIMKVLGPLFLTSLEEQFVAAGDSAKKLKSLRTRISKVRVFDPACGSGNFLIIAYRELRKLEMRVIEKLRETQAQPEMAFSDVPLSNFFGIEYADFAVETAKLSLWISEYQMNIRFGDTFGNAPPPLPLQENGNIYHGNALQLDWLKVCPPPIKHGSAELDNEVETYIAGNPPFSGSRRQGKDHKKDLRLTLSDFDGVNSIDYVMAWFYLAYKMTEKVNCEAAFVATSSICQGQSISLFWAKILGENFEISFAHLPFMWRNNAAKNAAVTCVIVGVRKTNGAPKYLFDDDQKRLAKNISPYLTNHENVFVHKKNTPPSGWPELVMGNQTIEDGHLILTREEKESLLSSHPEAEPFLRPLYGASDFVTGNSRYCIWVTENTLEAAKKVAPFRDRFDKVEKFRKGAGEVARSLTRIPYRFRYVHEAKEAMMVVPRTATQRREYLPVGLLSAPAIVTDAVQVVYEPKMFMFGIVSTKTHMVWVKTVAGRLKKDPRYSNTLVYNTFPAPQLSASHKELLEFHAWEIIKAREANIGKTIAQLYDPEKMPDNLRLAHQALDDAMDTIYVGRPFRNDTERLEHLFKLYAKEESRANA